MSDRPKFMLVTLFWGEWHTETFYRCALPALMAAGNIPELAKIADVEWHFWTDSPVNLKIEGIEIVQHSVFDGVNLNQRYAWQHAHWNVAREMATQKQAFIIFLAPDQVWSENCISYMARSLIGGNDAFIINGPRVLDTAREDLAPYDGNGEMALSGAALVRIAFRHLHPLMEAHDLGSKNACLWPEISVIRLSDNAWLSRQFGHETMAYNTRTATITRQLYPGPGTPLDKIDLVTDSDDATFISMAPDGHFEQNFGGREIEPMDLARFWRMHPSKINRKLARRDILWHSGPVDNGLIADASARFDDFIDKAEMCLHDSRTRNLRSGRKRIPRNFDKKGTENERTN